MMTPEEIEQYISENEPTKVDKCTICARWEKREWNTGSTTIIESYIYKNEPTHRQSFAVKQVTREEVSNG